MAAGSAAAALGGCDGPFSTLAPAGPAAAAIGTLWWVMLAGAAAILALVMVLFLLSFRRGGEGGGVGQGDRARERRWLLWGGLVFPVATLAALLAAALWTGERLQPRPAPGLVRVDADSSQYRWRFTARDAAGRARASEGVLRIPVGLPVDVTVTTADVIHAFWVPSLAGKIDAIPGHANRIRIRADRAGTYGGLCAEYCGTGHARHRFVVEAMAPDAYAAWIAGGGA